jgi:hypothetical protein
MFEAARTRDVRCGEDCAAPTGRAKVRRHELVAARLLRTYLRFVARHSSYVAVDQAGRQLELDALADRVARYDDRLVATYWIDNALSFATLSFAHPGLVAFARRFRFLIDDTYGGRLSAHSIASVGGRYTMLALPGDPLRLKQVGSIIAQRESCIFPVDGGGPYREAGTGIVGLASALRASIVPMAVHASRSYAVPHRSRVRVPVAGGRFIVGIGDAIRVDRSELRTEIAARLKSDLDALGATTGAVAHSGVEPDPPMSEGERYAEFI